MIKGKQLAQKVVIDKPTINYRKIDALNQSMLKIFDSDPVKFFEEFKLGKKRKEKTNTAMIIGSLVDFYLLACNGDEDEFQNRFDEKFALFEGNKGSGQVFILVDLLFEETNNSLNEEGIITTSFEERFSEAFRRTTSIRDGDGNQKYFKGKTLDKALEIFEKDGKEYFDTLLKNIGKMVVDISLVDKAKLVANNILTDPFTRELFYENDDIQVITHLPIEWKYCIDKDKFIRCKSEIDRLEINHTNKTIQVDDLKTNYDNESFDYTYIKNGYYIQNAFYTTAVMYWRSMEEDLKDYEVIPMRFIVGDTSANNRRPLIYSTSKEDILRGKEGFKLRGNYYRGIDELIKDIAWAEENEMWTCSKEAFDKKGQLTLNINYE